MERPRRAADLEPVDEGVSGDEVEEYYALSLANPRRMKKRAGAPKWMVRLCKALNSHLYDLNKT